MNSFVLRGFGWHVKPGGGKVGFRDGCGSEFGPALWSVEFPCCEVRRAPTHAHYSIVDWGVAWTMKIRLSNQNRALYPCGYGAMWFWPSTLQCLPSTNQVPATINYSKLCLLLSTTFWQIYHIPWGYKDK